VIQSVEEESNVLPGEILVAPFTDPGWTPYLVSSSGIVIDQGGLLSHGSIIAREYGIPTVVNVGPATRIIKTGDTVEVNGDQGTVRILSRWHSQRPTSELK
jgi:pyruvate,water dikinase